MGLLNYLIQFEKRYDYGILLLLVYNKKMGSSVKWFNLLVQEDLMRIGHWKLEIPQGLFCSHLE